MNWLKEIIKKLFFRNKIKLLNEPEQIINNENEKNEFFINLRRQAEVEQDEGNGYKIIQNVKLGDMV